MKENNFICLICGKKFWIIDNMTCSKLTNHIRCKHNISSKQYYLKYVAKQNEEKCKICGKQTRYVNLVDGFKTYCSNQCRFSDPDYHQHIKQKSREVCLEKYGVQFPMQNQKIAQKVKNTCLQIYGKTSPMKVPEIVKKAQQTCLKKYGRKSFTGTKKYMQSYRKTCLQKYGQECHQRAQQVKEKVKKTNIERYGGICPYNDPKIVQKGLKTQRKRQGGNGFQSQKILKKYINTLIQKYGNKSPYKFFHHQKTKLYYRSNLQKIFIQFCLENDIKVERGAIVEYNFQNCKHKYFIDFLIQYPDCRNRLVQTKGKHPWYLEQLESGKFKQKVKSAIKYSNQKKYLPFKVLFNKEEFEQIL